MSKRAVLSGMLVLAGVMGLAAMHAGTAAAQSASEKPAAYTYVSEWAVPRAMWADYKKEDDADLEILKKAFADGTIVSYGSFAVLNHQEGAATHGTWFSATSMANLMKMLEGLRSAPGAVAPVLAASKHWDFILSSTNHNGHSGTFTNGYLRVAQWALKGDGGDASEKIIKATMITMLEKVLADGAIHSYTIDRETVHSADPATMFVVIVANGAEGLDKFNAAVADMQKNNPTGLAAYSSLIDAHGHRDTLARVSIMANK